MPKIQGYEEQVVAQGALGGRANPDDFGANVGRATANFGAGLQDVADSLHQVEEAQDVTEAHVNMAKARAEWTDTLQARERTAVPGDDTFAPTLMKDMGTWLEKTEQAAKTPRGRQVYQTLGANMASEFSQRAIEVQANLAGRGAANSYDTLSKSAGNTAYNDHTQWEAVVAQSKAAIDDPAGIFSKVPVPVRDKFKQQLENDINLAAARGFVKKYPEATLQSMSPDELKLFKPWMGIIEANKVPGGKIDLSPEALAQAPEVTAAAAAKDVNPNIMLAQRDVGADHPAPADQAAAMNGLLGKFSGDYSKALAAYDMGAGPLTDVMRRWGSEWQSYLPDTTQAYVGAVLEKSGMTASSAPEMGAPAPAAEPTPARGPVASSLPFLNALSWEQQDQIVREGVQLQHTRMTMAKMAREEAEHEKGKRQESTINGAVQQIFDPKTYGAFDGHKIMADPELTSAQKTHLMNMKSARVRELQADGESRTNPVEFKRLVKELYATADDPTKVYSADNAFASYSRGAISFREFQMLRTEADQLRGDGSNFQKRVGAARQMAENAFLKDFTATLPGGAAAAADAYYRFTFDLNAKIDTFRTEKKDPSSLLTPGSKDYMLTPENLASYMPKSTIVMGAQAGKAAAQSKGGLKPGDVQGAFRFKGGDPGVQANWEPATQAPAPAPAPAPKPAAKPGVGSNFSLGASPAPVDSPFNFGVKP